MYCGAVLPMELRLLKEANSGRQKGKPEKCQCKEDGQPRDQFPLSIYSVRRFPLPCDIKYDHNADKKDGDIHESYVFPEDS